MQTNLIFTILFVILVRELIAEQIFRQLSATSTENKLQFYCGNQLGRKNAINPLSKSSDQRAQLIETIYGFNMYVDRKDYLVSLDIKNNGTWDPQNIHLIGEIVNPGDTVVNIGSQTGLEAIIMGKIIGPSGKMFIFQPYSVSNEILTKNIELNNLQNFTTIYRKGASNRKGTSAIFVDFDNTGGSTITPEHEKILKNLTKVINSTSQIEKVQLDALDNLIPLNIMVDFALIDVQKMEVSALIGMKEIILRSPHLIIMCQWQYLKNDKKNKNQTVQLLTFFKRMDYEIYTYQRQKVNYKQCKLGKLKKYQKIYEILQLSFTDLLFIPKNHKFLQKLIK